MDKIETKTPEETEEAKEKAEKLKKKKEQPKIKQYYTVKIESTGPVLLTYRVFAEDENEAFEMIKKNPNQSMSEPPKHSLSKLKRLKATVYQAGSSLIKLVKNF